MRGMRVVLNVPDNKVPLVVAAFCDAFAYQEMIPDSADPTGIAKVPNPEGKGAFVKRQIAQYVKDVVRAYQRRQIEAAFIPTDVEVEME